MAMTKEQALECLRQRDINTAMWTALGLQFEAFLRFAQATERATEDCIDAMQAHYKVAT